MIRFVKQIQIIHLFQQVSLYKQKVVWVSELPIYKNQVEKQNFFCPQKLLLLTFSYLKRISSVHIFLHNL